MKTLEDLVRFKIGGKKQQMSILQMRFMTIMSLFFLFSEAFLCHCGLVLACAMQKNPGKNSRQRSCLACWTVEDITIKDEPRIYHDCR